MKKLLLFGLICQAGLSTQAQVVMENKVPPFGTKYSMSSVTGLTEATSGANQTWDYSAVNLTAISSYTIVDPATLPQKIKDSVPTATYAAKIEVGAPSPDLFPYDFIENKTTYYLKVGVKSSGSSPVEKKNDTIMMFNQGYGTTQFYGGMNRRYDGYGTLTVKTKTYQNVVRLKMYATGSGDTLNQFFQFSPNFQMLLSYAKMAGNIQNVLYWEPTATIGMDDLTESTVALYPNPATDFVTIDLRDQNSNQSVSIYDLTGSLVKTVQLNNDQSKQQLDIRDLNKGVYFICVGTLNRKLIVQ